MTTVQKYLIAMAVGFIAAVALLLFTHKYWCPCHSTASGRMPISLEAPEIHIAEIQGRPLNAKDRSLLNVSRGKSDSAAEVSQQPIAISMNGQTPCPDNSNVIDTTLAWQVSDSSKKVIDSGFYHLFWINDCIHGRAVDLFVESTPHHAPPSAEGRQPFVSQGTVEAASQAYSLLKLSAFLEHDFARGNYTLGIRARITLGRIEPYVAASIGSENLPVGVDYVFWGK